MRARWDVPEVLQKTKKLEEKSSWCKKLIYRRTLRIGFIYCTRFSGLTTNKHTNITVVVIVFSYHSISVISNPPEVYEPNHIRTMF